MAMSPGNHILFYPHSILHAIPSNPFVQFRLVALSTSVRMGRFAKCLFGLKLERPTAVHFSYRDALHEPPFAPTIRKISKNNSNFFNIDAQSTGPVNRKNSYRFANRYFKFLLIAVAYIMLINLRK